MLRIALVSIFAIAAAAPEVFAQGSRGSRGEQDACQGDARRHCRKVLGDGDMVVFQCLQQNRRRLSQACRKVIDRHAPR